VEDLLLRKLYGQFERAVRRKDLGRALSLVRKFPALRNQEGDSGNLLSILKHSAPSWIEAALKAGLSPDAGSQRPTSTYLQDAACSGDLKALRLAIDHGADLERRNDWGETALGYACSWNQLGAARMLVEAGADVNAVEDDPNTGYRCTALDCARDPEIIDFLRSHGAKRLDELEPSAPAT
jgi:hypothetical protein